MARERIYCYLYTESYNRIVALPPRIATICSIVTFIRRFPHFSDEAHRRLRTVSRWKGRWCFLLPLLLLVIKRRVRVLAQLIVSVFNFLLPVYTKAWNTLSTEPPFTFCATCNLFVTWIAAEDKFGCTCANEMWFVMLLLAEINRRVKNREKKWPKIEIILRKRANFAVILNRINNWIEIYYNGLKINNLGCQIKCKIIWYNKI